jgi:hypothetical protein
MKVSTLLLYWFQRTSIIFWIYESVLFLLRFHGEQISKFGTLLAKSVSACLSPVPGSDYGHEVLCPVKGKGPILLTVSTIILPLENEVW